MTVTSPPIPDLDRVSAIIAEVAQAAIMPYFQRLRAQDIREKTGPTDLVTAADEEAERMLTPLLAALVPGSVVVGEEAVSADLRVLDRIHGEEPVWIIDPVDGTINFAAGKPAFAVIVAYVAGGRTLAGWIHDPVTGRTAQGAVGQGAWLDGRRIHFDEPVPLPRMVGALSTRFCSDERRDRLEDRAPGLGGIAYLSSAAQEYLRMLEGSSHFSLYHRLMPWDHAAGVLLLAEAGGWSATDNGVPYSPTVMSGTLINARDRESWTLLKEYLLG
ncbi:inositol monophosphatase [Azospirillum oleiclasticum]|uniref:inositol monophosphatase family protein n=1 Tax=Azospirillum oleiclasticum TaxID=2735135 RepID=UPI0031F2FBC0